MFVIRPSVWLTSGYYSSDGLLWESENIYHYDETFWAMAVHQETRGRVAYKYGGGNYHA